MFIVGCLRNNIKTNLIALTAINRKNTILIDKKVKCLTCLNFRSTTLMLPDNSCGLCHDEAPDYDNVAPELYGDDKSLMVACRTCNIMYAVVKPELQSNSKNENVHIKSTEIEINKYIKSTCFHCREKKANVSYIVPPIENRSDQCIKCMNRYLNNGTKIDNFICPPCEQNKSGLTEKIEISVKDFLDQNGTEIIGITNGTNNIFNNYNLYSNCNNITLLDEPTINKLKVKGKYVINTDEVLKQLNDIIARIQPELEMCPFCCNDFNKDKLFRICGRTLCNAFACKECLITWYGDSKLGNTISLPHLSCPCCKQKPAPQIWKKYNIEVSKLKYIDLENINNKYHYGWCIDCKSIVPAIERLCSVEAPVYNNTFRCDECREERAKTLGIPLSNTRKAPCCGAAVEKSGGCNHITCKCGKHWCWRCKLITRTSDEMYTHLRTVHEGIFPTNLNENEFYDDFN